jgi:hypothetical protein
MKTTQEETKPAVVPERATQAGETGPTDWEWVERLVWTERMLEALEKGVKGGVWFSLIIFAGPTRSFGLVDFSALWKPIEL